jgi:hypothetical protein
LYTSLNNTTRLERGDRTDLEPDKLAATLSKLRIDPNSHDFVTPLELYASIFLSEVTAVERDAVPG